MAQTTTQSNFVKKQGIFSIMGLVLMVVLVTTSSADTVLTNAIPSKRAVTTQNKVAPATEITIAVTPTEHNGDRVEKAEPTPVATAQLDVPVILIEPQPTESDGDSTTIQRRPTPSKVPVIVAVKETPSSTTPQVLQTEPVTEILIPVDPYQGTPLNSVEDDQIGRLLGAENSQPLPHTETEVAIVRKPTPSKRPIKQTVETINIDEVIPSSSYADLLASYDAGNLTASLTTPAKTPVAALSLLDNSPEQQAVVIGARSALIVDQKNKEVLFSRNVMDSMPIASITKLMTAMVVLDAKQNMNQKLTITKADIDTLKNSSSRLYVGAQLSRRDLLHLTLMSSENRAAHALSRNYPGGTDAFVKAMNAKAKALGLSQTHFVDPTGLSAENQSNALDLVWLVDAAYDYPLIRQLSTSKGHKVSLGKKRLSFINTNRLIDDDKNWKIGLQKTGYIREAGYCMVMQTKIQGKNVIMVLLDTDAKTSRISDAKNMRAWVAS